jgi:hypothetical protein
MKLNITNIDENYLSSDVVSIALLCLALPCFALPWLGLLFEFAAPKPEIRHSILLDQYPSKSLAGTQKISPRQPPESVRVFLSL